MFRLLHFIMVLIASALLGWGLLEVVSRIVVTMGMALERIWR